MAYDNHITRLKNHRTKKSEVLNVMRTESNFVWYMSIDLLLGYLQFNVM